MKNGLANSWTPIENISNPIKKKNTNKIIGRTLNHTSENTLKNIGRFVSPTPALSATVPQTPRTPNRANIAPNMINMNLPVSEPGFGFSSPLEKSIAIPDATTTTPSAQNPEKNVYIIHRPYGSGKSLLPTPELHEKSHVMTARMLHQTIPNKRSEAFFIILPRIS
ncbi:MAG: hypothetical protein IKJ89_07450 [Kiritimatiellae bacterium]|nr:hypothetical protein [Kiritimatiellia bacterium]